MLLTQSGSYKEQGRKFLLSGRGLGMMFNLLVCQEPQHRHWRATEGGCSGKWFAGRVWLQLPRGVHRVLHSAAGTDRAGLTRGCSWGTEQLHKTTTPSDSSPESWAQPGEQKAAGRPQSRLPVPTGACKRAGKGLFAKACSDGPRANGFKTERGQI